MKIHELRQLMNSKKVEARGLIETDTDKAEALVKEVRELEKKIKLLEQLEEDEARSLGNQMVPSNATNEPVNEMRAIVKQIMGENLTKEERASIKTTDNSAVIPDQFVNKIQEIKKGFGSLKELCDVIPVHKNSGTIPVIDLEQNDLPEVNEGDNITEGTLVTTDLPFTCHKHGLIQSLTSELVDDAEVEIEGLAKKNFTELVTRVENTKILKVLKDNATDVTATDYTAIETTIDEALPSYKAGLCTITTSKGYAHLKNMKDKEGRPLNLITIVNGKYYFNDKPLYVVDSALLTTTAGKNYTFIVANVNEAVKYCDRKQVTIARSTEAGFKDNTIKLRILERFGVVKGSTRSVSKIEF